MKSLIIGSQGLVGTALTRYLPDAIQGVQMEAKNKNQMYIDMIKYETGLKAFSIHRPKVVYLAGAITDVNKCEDQGTGLVNVKGTIEVLRLCEQFEAKLVFYSSSYVFDGTKLSPYSSIDEVNPIQAYGKQKATVENVMLESDAEVLIIRTVGVFGQERKKRNFVQQVVKSIFAGKDVFAPEDQYMNPIWSNDLARISVDLVKEDVQGILHVAGDTCISKFEFAKKIASYFDYTDKVIPLTTSEMNQRAPRPKMGCLNCSDLSSLGIDVPALDAGLQKFLGSEFL
jgi:dTDP-4-dehydrorhamnose reductase